MDRKVELPVNKNHCIRSGTAGLYSIMTSNAYTGKLNAILSNLRIWEDSKNWHYDRDYVFKIDSNNVELENENGKIFVKSNPYAADKNVYIYKKKNNQNCSKTGIEVKVDYLQEANAWSYVKVNLSMGIRGYSCEFKEAIFEEEYSIKLTAKGKIVVRLPGYCTNVQIEKKDKMQEVYMRMELSDMLLTQYSFDGECWITICEIDVNNVKYEEMGVYVCPKINPVFYELFPRSLQLYFSKATKILTNHIFDEDQCFCNSLVKYQFPCELLVFSDEEIINWFVNVISKKYYVRLRLNEYYVPDTPSYKLLDFPHVNYLYGYDRDREVFMLIGYNRYLKFIEISFEEFLCAFKYKKHLKDKIALYKYCSCAEPQEFPVKTVISNLKAYLKGSNSCFDSINNITVINNNPTIVFGIDIYDAIAENPEYIECFIRDVRLVYKLQERYMLIKNMFELMNISGMLTDEAYEVHRKSFENLLLFTESLKELILKHYVKSISDINIQIQAMLLKLKEKDEEATRKLIWELERQQENENNNY